MTQLGKLAYNDICGALLGKEMRWKSMIVNHIMEMHIMFMTLVLARTNTMVGAKREIVVEMIEVEANLGRKIWSVIIVIKRDTSRKIVMP